MRPSFLAIYAAFALPYPVSAHAADAKPACLTIVAGQGVTLQSSKIASADAGTLNPLDTQLLRHLFTLHNNGSQSLTITQLEPSCLCTSASVTGDTSQTEPSDGSVITLAPGGQATIAVNVSLFHHAPGAFTNSVFVHVKDEADNAAILQVNGSLKPIVTFSPDTLDFGKMHSGTTHTLSFIVIADPRLAMGNSLPRMVSSNGDVRLKAGNVSVYAGGKLSQTYTATLKVTHKGPIEGRLAFAPIDGAIAGGGQAGDLAVSMLGDAGMEIRGNAVR